MRAIFVMMKVEPGTLPEVADRVTDLESFSEAYSISGAYDLMVKLYVDDLTLAVCGFPAEVVHLMVQVVDAFNLTMWTQKYL